MALIARLDIEGLATDRAYYRIGSVMWDVSNPSVLQLRIDGYASKNSFQSGRNALFSLGVAVPTDERLFNAVRNDLSACRDISDVLDLIRKQAYILTKRDTQQFSDATDD